MGGSSQVRYTSGGSEGYSPTQWSPLGQRHPLRPCSNQSARPTSRANRPPVSYSWEEAGARTVAAAQLAQGFEAFPFVTIGVTNTEVTSNGDADDGAAAYGMDCS